MVIAGIVIALLAGAALGAGSMGLRQQTKTAGRVVGKSASQPDAVFFGGALTRTVSATWPLARLELSDWGVRLDSSARFLHYLPLAVPTWEARYEELVTVRHVTAAAGSGLRFAVSGAPDAVVFWSRRCSEILDRLGAAGAPIDRSLTSLKLAGGT
jgi:hypothetical protein